MGPAPVTADGLFDLYHERLQLRWLAGKRGSQRSLLPEPGDAQTSLIGHLNFIHPHRIQVLGASEFEYLHSLGKNSYEDALANLFSGQSAMVVLTEEQPPPRRMLALADKSDIPLLTSTLGTERLIDHLNYYLTNVLADKIVVHGVFMDVMGTGVLLTGESAVGKSELALELITRGHRLVADDAPEFVRVAPDTLQGHCPDVLRDFLEVRGLGILNIRAMFGDSAVKHKKFLRLIVHLTGADNAAFKSIDRLTGSRHSRRILDVDVPEIDLPVAPGRNLAVLVEAAARNHILYHNGYDAAEEFIQRQQRFLNEKSE